MSNICKKKKASLKLNVSTTNKFLFLKKIDLKIIYFSFFFNFITICFEVVKFQFEHKYYI